MAAAGNPTISTFLELRDNMSAGVRAVAEEIGRLKDAARAAEDAIRRMNSAAAARVPRGSGAPPSPPRGPRAPGTPGAPGGPSGGELFKFTGGIFNAVTRANLLVDAIENAVVGATNAVTGLLKYTVKAGEEYENQQLRITNTFKSMNLAPTVETAYAGAAEIMDTLRSMAAKLPGEAKDYYNVFASALPDAIASGMTDIKKYTDFAGRYTAVAMSRMVDAPQAGRDLQEMLQGRAHLRTKTYQELRTYIGLTAREFNKLAPEKRMALLMDAVAKAGGAMSLASETANAKFGELKSRIDELFILGGKPFFEGIKATVTDINFWLDQNKEKIVEIANVVSTTLARAFRGIETIVESIGNKLLGAGSKVDTSMMSIKELEARREQVRKQMGKSFGVSDISPHMWWRRGMLYGEYEELTDQIWKQEKAYGRVGAAKEKFHKQDIKFRQETRMDTATPEVQMIARWRSGFFDNFEKLGYNSAQEAFGRFAETLGLTEKETFDLWQQLVQRGDISIPTAPTATRELKVEFNNNRFDIRQEFAEGFDPDRIAVAFASDLARAGEMKLAAVTGPAYPN